MVKVIHLADDGTEKAAVEARRLHDRGHLLGHRGHAACRGHARRRLGGPDACDLPRQALERRQKILTRIRD